MPAMHLGMTGMVMASPFIKTDSTRLNANHIRHVHQIKGIEPDWYVRRPKKAEMAAEQEWPPPKVRTRSISTLLRPSLNCVHLGQ